jgi:ferric iron reductase protein FhuF
MCAKLTEQERKELSRFRYTDTDVDPFDSTKVGDLLFEGRLKAFLEEVQAEVKAPDLTVASSVFMKRYAFVAVIYLYALSKWNKRLRFSLDTLLLRHREDKGSWLPEYSFDSLLVETFSGEDREAWRKEAVTYLFKDIFYPVLAKLSREGKISEFILWENLAIYIYWLYETILVEYDDLQLRDDFDYIVNRSAGSHFGPYQRNPLHRYYKEPVYLQELDQEVRIRTTCCFSYQLGEKRTYCKTCPLYCKPFNTGRRNRN